MKELTKADFTLELTELVINTGMEDGNEIQEQILKNQEKAKNWDKIARQASMIDMKFLEGSDKDLTLDGSIKNKKIVDKLKKELSELDGWLDSDDTTIKYFIENTLGVEND